VTLSVVLTILPVVAMAIWCRHLVVQSDYGRAITTLINVDWAHTLALVESYALDNFRDVSHGNLGEMSVYPPFSHWTVATVARWCDAPPPQVLQNLSLASLVLGCAGCACLWTRACMKPGTRPLAAVLSLIALGLASWWGLGFSGMLVPNFFFPQAFGTTLAIITFLVVDAVARKGKWVSRSFALALSLPCLWLLLATHLVPSCWFAGAVILSLSLRIHGWRIRVPAGLALAAVFGSLVVMSPGLAGMRSIAGNDGLMLFHGFQEFSDHQLALIGRWSLFIVCGWTVYRLFTARRSFWVNVADQAAPLAAFAVFFVQWALFGLAGQGSAYAVKKTLLMVGPTFSLLFLDLGRRADPSLSTGLWARGRGPLVAGLFAASFFAQRLEMNSPYDQRPLFEARRALLPYRYRIFTTPTGRAYPQSMQPVMNYYLAIAVLGYPRDADTMGWFLEGTQGRTPLELPEGR
jgi:hypothetical protein